MSSSAPNSKKIAKSAKKVVPVVVPEEAVNMEELALVPMEVPQIVEELDDIPPQIETNEIGYKAKYEELYEMYETLKAK